MTTIPVDVRRSLSIEEGDAILWEVDASRGIAVVRVVKNPIKFLNGRYSDPNLRYEVVEETADMMVMEMTHADDRA
ncbi:AbrB/MazE/SpoVT family DNA-binding domain-containing protein [Candidatus Bathyarchaeota archaeon]|nr:AbrB/MazE/SpoVT family DNA-binding domain-containing protein [Candidatus Bathyarchaeota archaeon]